MEQTSELKKFNFKQYYENNPDFRDRHLAKLAELIECDCGSNVSRAHKARHERTPKHLKLLARNEYLSEIAI